MRIKEKELGEKKRLQEEEERLRIEQEKVQEKYKELHLISFISKIEHMVRLRNRKNLRDRKSVV